MENLKFCKDCKFSLGSTLTSFHCRHPNQGFNLVTGTVKEAWANCVREDEALCGKDAKWFEIRPPKPVPPPTSETICKTSVIRSNNQTREQKPWYKFWK